MNVRKASVAAVRLTGRILSIVGVAMAVVGVGCYFLVAALTSDVESGPDSGLISFALGMWVWTTAAGLIVVGVVANSLRVSLVEGWGRDPVEDGAPSVESSPWRTGLVAVGICGICLCAIALGDILASAIAYWVFEEVPTGLMWRAASLLLVGVLLALRPRWVTRLWASVDEGAV